MKENLGRANLMGTDSTSIKQEQSIKDNSRMMFFKEKESGILKIKITKLAILKTISSMEKVWSSLPMGKSTKASFLRTLFMERESISSQVDSDMKVILPTMHLRGKDRSIIRMETIMWENSWRTSNMEKVRCTIEMESQSNKNGK